MTCSALTPGRSASGLSEMKNRAELAPAPPPPPTDPPTDATAGSAIRMAATRASTSVIVWNEVSAAPCAKPPISPVSCVGKKSFGTMM